MKPTEPTPEVRVCINGQCKQILPDQEIKIIIAGEIYILKLIKEDE
jgi:hypothetical protein